MKFPCFGGLVKRIKAAYIDSIGPPTPPTSRACTTVGGALTRHFGEVADTHDETTLFMEWPSP
jgi:hypothetical protein